MTCTKCREREQAPGQRYCRECRNASRRKVDVPFVPGPDTPMDTLDIGVEITPVATVWNHHHHQECAANARLIAAAPDLLAALELFVERYTRLIASGDCGRWNPETDEEVIRARAVIRKATEG